MQEIMIQTLVTRWVWQPPDPPCNYGSRAPGPACLTEDREMHQGRHARALGTAPRSTEIFFFHASRKFLALSLPPPLRSIPEGIQAGVSPARDIIQALENSAKVVPRPWKLEEGWWRLWPLGCL